MKWISFACIAGWLSCASLLAPAQELPDSVVVNAVTVGPKNIPIRPHHALKLGPHPANVTFHIGATTNSHLPKLRVRYKLDGYDSRWQDGNCDMFLAVRFYNATGDQIAQQAFKVVGESAGWNGSLATSALGHRREIVTVPPLASNMIVVISSGGPPATIGVYVVANLVVSKVNGHSEPVALLEFPHGHGSLDETNLNVEPDGWLRDGNIHSMAKVVNVGHAPGQKALAVLDNSPTSHAEWHNSLASAPAVTPGDRIAIEWNEMFAMGVADLRSASYKNLPAGRFLFHVAEFDMFGKLVGAENQLTVIVPPPFWQRLWFWPLCAALAIIIIMGQLRYLAWRKVRREMLFLKNQQVLEKERLRIAQDIHDDLGARITEISLASALAKKNAGSPEIAEADFDRITDMSRELVSALYETVWAVNPENDNLDSLGTYLCQITNHLCKQAQLPCRLEVGELPRAVQVSSQIRHNIAMAVKEATHNAIKHAQATEITLRIAFNKPDLTIRLTDNGVGFKAGETNAASGHGLNNLKKRLATIGGRCEITSSPGHGTAVEIHLNL